MSYPEYPTPGYEPGGSQPYPGQPYPGQPYPGQPYQSRGPVRQFRDVSANWGWAVVAVIFFWPIGIAAVKAAGRVLPALLDGDVESAMSDSRRARTLGIVALCIIVALVGLYVVFIVIAFSELAHDCRNGC